MVKQKLQSLGITLPAVVPPVASYVPAKRSGSYVYVSGQLPMKDGQLMMKGPIAGGRSIDEAKAAMRQCFLNGLAAAGLVCDIDAIKSVVRLGVFVASAPGFTDQHLVANGASDTAKEIFGDAGVHSRAAVGVASLPLDASVELEILFEV